MTRTRTLCTAVLTLLAACSLPAQAQTGKPFFSIDHPFDGAHGSLPSGLTASADGYLYGTTQEGGKANLGVIFRDYPGLQYDTLFAFNGPNGAYPIGGVRQGTDGAFYGTTYSGGAPNDQYGNVAGGGTVYRITGEGTLTVLYRFSEPNFDTAGSKYLNSDGAYPSAPPVQASDGTLYGTTSVGGVHGRGVFYKLTSDGTYTVLHNFRGSEGEYPRGPLTYDAARGAFYGLASGGGAFGLGTVYCLFQNGVSVNLHSFDGTYGATPSGGLTFGADGRLYGVTQGGGSLNGQFEGGTAFRINTYDQGVGFLTLHKFVASRQGVRPVGGLALAPDGDFYGVTNEGGTASTPGLHGSGTIFRMTPDGITTTLYRFERNRDGIQKSSFPNVAPVFRNSDPSALYGTAGLSLEYEKGRNVIYRLHLP